MRLSIGRVSAGGHTTSDTADWDGTRSGIYGTAVRQTALALAVVLVLGCVGLLFFPAKPAAAGTPGTQFASGQVFASVGNSAVSVYSQATPSAPPNAPSTPSLDTTLNDGLNESYTAGSAFDAHGNLYVADDYSGDVSEYSPNGTLDGVFASGLQNPLSLAFDNNGNLYVGQQSTPYIAEFNSTGQLVRNIGPLTTELAGDDWIALADQCNVYYTTEGSDILHYNICTNTQEPNFNLQSFPSFDSSTGLPVQAFELQVVPGGDVLVADSNADILLDPNGNVLHTYTCASLPGCQGSLFAISLDPNGTSFWTGDSTSGDIWQVALGGANDGYVQQQIDTHSGALYGLSVDDQIEVAAPTPVANTTPSTLAVQPVSGNFSSPTPVSAVLTNSSGQPIVNEPVTFTLNGSEQCTGTTDNTGTATCVITPGEPSQSYTLTASFGGDTSTSTPIGSDSSSSTFTVNPDSSTVTYTGPTTAVNGQPITLTGTLSDTSTSSPLPTKVVTFTIGTNPTTQQSCNATTDSNGNVSCTIASVDQPASSEPITTSFGADSYDTAATATNTLSVTEPTSLTVNSATSDYSDATTVSGVLTDGNTNAPIAGEPVTFTLNGTETCTGTTNSIGVASCPITPGEPAATYTLTGSFAGDTTQPLQLLPAKNSANFVVTLEETGVTYTGPTSIYNSQNLTVSGTLTSDSGATPVVGRTLTFVLGGGSTAQTCTTAAPTNSSGTGSCTINNVNQTVGPVPVTVTFTSDGYYQSANASGTVNVGPVQTGTTLTVSPATGDYSDATNVSATLIDNYTSAGAANEPVTITLNGTQSCTGTTNASGVVTCSITPNEPAGTYSLSASFAGDATVLPHLLASTGSSTFVVTHEEATLTYTGATSATNGSSATLSGVLTTDDPAHGTPISGRTVTFTLGSGTSAQSCSGTTNSSGAASCVIAKVNQTTSPLPVTAKFAGDAYYVPATATGSVVIDTPTNLSVSAVTGSYGQPTTVTGTLTNAVTGAPISGQTVTLTLNGTQTCTAVTNSSGKASCSITPNEPASTYTISGSFGGSTSTTTLLPSSGHNCFVVTTEPTTLTYTGPASVSSGQTLTLTSVLTTAGGTPISGQPVVMTLGSGKTVQSCTGTTNSSGVASCTITVNQVPGSVAVTASYSGSSYYLSSSASSSETIGCQGGGGGSGGGGGPCGGSQGGGGCGGGCRPPVGGCGEGCG